MLIPLHQLVEKYKIKFQLGFASWWVGKLVDQKDFTQYRFSDGLGIDVQEKLLALLDIENAKILPGK